MRDKRLTIYVDEETKEILRSAAKMNGIKLSSYVNNILLRWISEEGLKE